MIKMKRSVAKSIKAKQSSAYKYEALKPPTIYALQQLKSFPPPRGFSQAQADAAAEKIMNQGYSRLRNPICSSCYVQKAINGSCNCS
jgi:hypothetical protein